MCLNAFMCVRVCVAQVYGVVARDHLLGHTGSHASTFYIILYALLVAFLYTFPFYVIIYTLLYANYYFSPLTLFIFHKHVNLVIINERHKNFLNST